MEKGDCVLFNKPTTACSKLKPLLSDARLFRYDQANCLINFDKGGVYEFH